MPKTLDKWRKGVAEWIEGDTAFLSVVFSWDIDDAYQRAIGHKQAGRCVRIGGPASHVGRKAFAGVADEVGGEIPEAVLRHNPMATYASRGCPVNCWFCIVPSMEGREFSYIEDFTPRPILCDNNLSGLPTEYQDHIIKRYQRAGVMLWDAQSGFEPRTFDEDTYARWRWINRGPWRLAYDDMGDRPYIRRALQVLAGESQRQKRIYVLIGNEPVAECMQRIREVIEWGGEPHVQPLIKLNAHTREPWVRHDWTRDLLIDAARWANGRLWRKLPFSDFDRRKRKRYISESQLTLI